MCDDEGDDDYLKNQYMIIIIHLNQKWQMLLALNYSNE